MAKPLSIDLRERVMKFLSKGNTIKQAADNFSLSRTTIWRWKRHLEITGNVAPKPRGRGRPCLATPEQIENMVELLIQQPDLTLRQLKEKSGIPLHLSRIHQELKRRGITLKKKHLSQQKPIV